jgi:LysM repeat protein
MKLKHKFSVLFFAMILFVVTAIAQDDYLVHSVKKGETLSVIAKHYRTTTGAIMHLNGMNSKSKLKIGQKIKIPSGSTVAVKEAKPQPVAAAVPAETKPASVNATSKLHTVGAKETLYSISKKYKVTVAAIQQWNHLKNTNIHSGQKLVVGYTDAAQVPTNPVSIPVETKADISAPVVVTPQPQQQAVTTPIKKETQTATAINSANVGSEGLFVSLYQRTDKELSGDAATFKTASGWLDKKYYILINNVAEGTIVRVASNNKAVYAKVLGPLPDIKEDTGLLARISNAAAASLGINDAKFSVIVNY